ncbi:MAG: pyridoxamine 5'-phosphate oxidase family protein [Elusimicrobiota bacterium]|jgi:uncharacterized pyridoxamine 5'-phosphate oxidase family protein|nr:pyridoxamine 5'-phosphate oxidase family protein [Elusimicrobiota bacterium]
MKRIVDFLMDAKVFFLATVDGDSARCRPFGVTVEFEDKLYFATGAAKAVCKQLQKEPKFEISAMSKDGAKWIRVNGKAVIDNNVGAKKKLFEIAPNLANIYGSYDSPAFAVFYADNLSATIYSFEGAPEKIV